MASAAVVLSGPARGGEGYDASSPVLSHWDPAPAVEPLLDHAFELVSRGDLPGARKVLDGVAGQYPDSPDVFQRRGYVRCQLGDQKGAIEDFTRAISLRPNYWIAFLQRGVAHLALGDNRQAVDDTTTSETIYRRIGGNPVYHIYRARAEANLGLTEAAAADLDLYVKFAQQDDAGWGERAGFRYTHGDPRGAFEDYKAAVQFDRLQSGRWLLGLANLQAMSGDQAGATATYATCLANNPRDADAHLDRGMLEVVEHYIEDARDDFSAAAAGRPHDARAHQLLAQALHTLHDNQGAVAEFTAALAAAPNNAYILECRGLCRADLLDFAGAAADLDRAAALQPAFAAAYADRAAVERHHGYLPGAVAYFTRAIAAAKEPPVDLTVPRDYRPPPPMNEFGNPSAILPDFSAKAAAPPKTNPAYYYYLRALDEVSLNKKAEALSDAQQSVALMPIAANQRLVATLEGRPFP